MNASIKLFLSAFLTLIAANSFSQNFNVTGLSNPIMNIQPCDSFITLSLAPLQAASGSNADYAYGILGDNYTAGPIQVDVIWGDGTSSTHNGQMTSIGTDIVFIPELTHQYMDNNQHTMILNVSNPINSSQAAHTTLIQVQPCTTFLYAFTQINCPGVDPNLSSYVPYVFTDSQGNQFTEWMVNGNVNSNQLAAGNYTVTIAQWWLDNNGLIITSVTPQTISMSPGGAYTFQVFLECNPNVTTNCLAGTVFCDQNQNGVLDGNESGLINAQILLTSGNQSYTITSGTNGSYSFSYVDSLNGISMIQIDPNWLSQNGFGNGSAPYTFYNVACDSGTQIINLPVICDSTSLTEECVGGWLFCDENNNGILDPNETGFANAPVQIMGNNSSVTVYTNANGNFFYSGNSLGGTAIVMLDQNWLNQNGYTANGNLVFTVQTDCDLAQPVYFPINCNTQTTPCTDLWTTVQPWIGYYQNQVNYVKLKWGNNGPSAAQSYTLTLNYPAGVTPVLSSIQNSNYVLSGNSISWTVSSSSSFFTSTDIINFNVPGGLSNGVVHNYSSTIVANGNNQDCNLGNNGDSLSMILGNSYDPNDKTVNNPEIISPDVDDEMVYRIRFQNTGTAPAQNIYVLDTLDVNLDWSTFELLDATHYIQVIDLGNGVKKFNFPNIWLVDSTESYELSQGSLTYRIKENTGNSVGVDIHNTAYIYFDWNPAIVTNTTYNVNAVLGVSEMNHSNFNVYPNPFSSGIHINSEFEIEEVKLFDVHGRLIYANFIGSIDNKYLPNLNSGVYVIHVKIAGEWSTQRIIKN